jgi:phosphomannomutase/phosphoglucomutase
VKPTGFREYDARWLFPSEINLMGVQALGMGLGTLVHEMGVRPDIVTGHDFRAYSSSIKYALISGLMAAGMRVRDIGLALSPMAYFGQFALDCPCVAMVTASHNDNGWTGVKMGANRPMTFGPDEMARLRDIVLAGGFAGGQGGSYEFVPDFPARYIADLTTRPKITRALKVVAACATASAGAFAPQVLEALGCEVVPLDCELDHTFPRYNPNPRDMGDAARDRRDRAGTGADVGLGFDGGRGTAAASSMGRGGEIFADKVGVMLARDLSQHAPGPDLRGRREVDRLFRDGPGGAGARRQGGLWKTGHSHIKRRVNELGALAGFEKSGHFFFNTPVGRGYDDGLVTAIAVIDMLDRNPDRSMADLYRALPKTWGSPTMSPKCADEVKYGVVDRVVARFTAMKEAGKPVAGQAIRDLVTVNGVRVTAADGTWGLGAAHRRTSRNSSSWWRAPSPKVRSARCSRPSTGCCARTRRSAPITRRSEGRSGRAGRSVRGRRGA